MKIIVIFISFIFILCSNIFPQNITNTLGSSGTFSIKDGSANYLTLNQSTGNVILYKNFELGNTLYSSSLVGVITKAGARFIHNYKAPGTDGYNTFVGLNAGNFTMAGLTSEASYNTGVGYGSLVYLTTGNKNSAFGHQSLYNTTIGSHNSALGNQSLYYNTFGYNNTAVGYQSSYSNTSGYDNSSFGFQSLYSNTTGFYNTAIGMLSLYTNTTGSNNTSVGFVTLTSNTTGENNTAIGSKCLYFNSGGMDNTAIGYLSLYYNSIGYYNVGLGRSSLESNTTGTQNTALGTYSSKFTTTGINNTSAGAFSLYANITGNNNTSIGTYSLWNSTIGESNTSVGRSSLESNTTGSNNTALGFNTGSSITTGSNLTCIGFNSQPTSPGATNQITLGNSSVTSLRCNVTTITSLSDARDKKNIHDLNLGLNFITKLKPRIYNWDKREWYDNNISDGSKMQETPTAGFIAQELDEVQTTENAEWLNLVLKDNPEKWEATPGNLLPVMVKAIQELNDKCDSLQNENKILTGKLNEVEDLKEKLLKLTSQIENLNSITDELKMSSGNTKYKENNIQFISNENTK